MKIGTHRNYFIPIPFRLRLQDIQSHWHIIGKTGMGKSKFLAHIAATQISSGIPSAIIDPHSDLADDILMQLIEKGYFDNPANRKKFLYIDFSNKERFVPFNYLQQPYDMHTIARNFVEVCFRAWPSLEEKGATFENIMLAAIPVLVANSLPLTALDDLLVNRVFREKLLQKVRDEHIIRFFRNQVDKWGKDIFLMIGSAQRRYSLIMYTPALRHSIGHKENSIDFRKIIDEGISVVCNLGGLDKQTQKMIGNFLTVGFETAALSRAAPGSPRNQYHIIIDEFQNFSSQNAQTFADILAEARKYKVFLKLSHQNWGQLDEHLQTAIENVGLQAFFQVGYESAVWAAPRLFGFNQTAIKEAVSKSEKDVSSLSTYAEQYEVSARELYEGLGVREAYIRTDKTTKIKTVFVKESHHEKKLSELKEYYAQTLLHPIENVIFTPSLFHKTIKKRAASVTK